MLNFFYWTGEKQRRQENHQIIKKKKMARYWLQAKTLWKKNIIFTKSYIYKQNSIQDNKKWGHENISVQHASSNVRPKRSRYPIPWYYRPRNRVTPILELLPFKTPMGASQNLARSHTWSNNNQSPETISYGNKYK